MKTGIATLAVLVYVALAYDRVTTAQAPVPATAASSPQQALIDQYCMGCHSDKVRSGGLALSDLKLDAADQHAEIAEKVIRKLRGGLILRPAPVVRTVRPLRRSSRGSRPG